MRELLTLGTGVDKCNCDMGAVPELLLGALYYPLAETRSWIRDARFCHATMPCSKEGHRMKASPVSKIDGALKKNSTLDQQVPHAVFKRSVQILFLNVKQACISLSLHK